MRLGLAIIFIMLLGEASAQLPADRSASHWYEEGQKSMKNGSFEAAVSSFDTIIAEGEENDKYWDAWYGKGIALYDLKRYKDGLDLCDDILNDPNSPQGERRARFLALDGDFYKAYEDKYGEPPITRTGNSRCSGEIPDNYQLAMTRYDEALGLDSNSALSWNSKGIALGSVCRLDESIESFDRALSIDSDLAEVWNNKGVSFDWLGRHDQSLGCYDRAIRLKPEMAVAWMNRACTLSLDMSLLSLAQENASRAIKLDPSLENETSLWTWRYLQLF
jgi:tetratricopeptide (TPR) repeat protein